MSHILGQHLRGSFDVTNFSDQLPLKFEITAPDGVVLSLCRGLLEGTARNKKDEVRNSVRIDFSLHSRCVSVCLCVCVSVYLRRGLLIGTARINKERLMCGILCA